MIPLRLIEARLNRSIGLDAASVGPSTILLAVQSRMKARSIKSLEAYHALLEQSGAEFQRLIEAVVIPETWFFRDRQPFLALGDWAVRQWFPAHPQGVLRLLSMPCSTGEEPFSMVMALLDAGVPPERFSVEAVDINGDALARAHKGLYGRNSFRGTHLEYRERYFKEVNAGTGSSTPASLSGTWQLDDRVRRQVQFRQVNLLDPSSAPAAGSRDVLFCRNLLIYLDREAQRRVIEGIRETLAPGGLLFVGHAEAYLFSSFGFETARFPMAFAFLKPGAAPGAPKPARAPVAAQKTRAVSPSKKNRPILPASPLVLPLLPTQSAQSPKAAPAKAAAAAVGTGSPESLLDECQRLADAGRLDGATEKGEAYLQLHGPSARAYYLLGLIKDAAGMDGEAAAFYRKALYLEPAHIEALAHLALLSRRSGDTGGARRLQQRLQRLESIKTGSPLS